MEPGGHLYIIGVGDDADWEAGRGSLYYVEDKNGERAMLVFTTPEKAWEFVSANLHRPEAHITMLESIGADHAPPLTEGKFVLMPVDSEGIAMAAVQMDIDYLVRDIRPGDQQETLRFPK